MDAKRFILYIAVVVSVLLPLFFRSRYAVRVVCVAALAGLGLLHSISLLTLHRLVLERGYQHYTVAPGGTLPEDYKVAVRMVQELSQGEMALVLLLVFAFSVLALLPLGRSVKR